jgi:hypothetical protein
MQAYGFLEGFQKVGFTILDPYLLSVLNATKAILLLYKNGDSPLARYRNTIYAGAKNILDH